MQNRELVFDFGIPETQRNLFKITASRVKCKIKNLFLILAFPRRSVIYSKLLQVERNAKSGELVFDFGIPETQRNLSKITASRAKCKIKKACF
ncbi:hypothetical protein [Sodaliphilus pleomorphus]|uniref:hypothetical protein n=1 Tax=Sodaliphilus pleomorphus TaxID=2606626 RepID=UPI001981BFF5|nr:hypothetical protein [Sodaliphilus pleomorphus]